MHQKIPVDSERGEGDLSGGGNVRMRLSWAAFISGGRDRAPGPFWIWKEFLKGTDDFNIQSQIL